MNDEENIYKISPDEDLIYSSRSPFDKKVSREKLEAIVEWFYENYPDADYVIMGNREIIIKDKTVATHYKLVWVG